MPALRSANDDRGRAEVAAHTSGNALVRQRGRSRIDPQPVSAEKLTPRPCDDHEGGWWFGWLINVFSPEHGKLHPGALKTLESTTAIIADIGGTFSGYPPRRMH
jgi:hypothetical protein